MTKKNIKKLIITCLLLTILVLFFLQVKYMMDNRYNDSVSIVKKILTDKYDHIKYSKDDKYVYGYYIDNNNYKYDIYDLHGNNIYSFTDHNLLDIKSIYKNYFIVKKDKYYLYDNDYNEVLSGNKIVGLSDYMIMYDDNLLDYDGNYVLNNVTDYRNYDNNIFEFNNNYITDKKGNILLDGYKIVDEIKTNYETDFFILKKDKYYTFFPGIKKILGSGFDSYEIGENVYMYIGYDKYLIYSNGLRKKVETFKINNDQLNKYNTNSKFIIDENRLFARDRINGIFGILNIKNDKFIPITSESIIEAKKLNKRYWILNGKENIVYDVIDNRLLYESKYNIEDMIYYDNYRVINKNNKYVLLNQKGKEVISSDKKIVLLNKKMYFGNIDDNSKIYNIETGKLFDLNRINNKYFKYSDDKYYLLDSKGNLIEEYDNNFYATDDLIVYSKNNNIYFKDIKNKKEEIKSLDYKITSISTGRNVIIVETSNDIEIFDSKGDRLKKIKNRKLESVFNNDNGDSIIITSKEKNNKKYTSSYIIQ